MGMVLSPWKHFTDPAQIYDYPMPTFSVPQNVRRPDSGLEVEGVRGLLLLRRAQ